jgi:transcriptional regulator with XRE-family HTH domain
MSGPDNAGKIGDQAMETLGRRLAQARRASGLTLAALAQRSEVSSAYISQIETAAANPTLRSLAQVAAALDLSLGELLGSPDDAQLPAPRFEPRFASVPRVATQPGERGIFDLTAVGSSQLAIRLVHGTAHDHAEPITHPGEEFLTVLAGRCSLRVNDLSRELGPHDSCHYAASDVHQLTDVSEDLLLVVIFTEE